MQNNATVEEGTHFQRNGNSIRQAASNLCKFNGKVVRFCSSMCCTFWSILCNFFAILFSYTSELKILILFQITICRAKSVLFALWVCPLFVFRCCGTIFEVECYMIAKTVAINVLRLPITVTKRLVFWLISFLACLISRCLQLLLTNAKIRVSSQT